MTTASIDLRQFHNQAETSPLHTHLVRLWHRVAVETNGALVVEVCAENNRIAGSDPAALALLQHGEIAFFTLMGGLLAQTVPLADFQSVPFAYRDAAQALQVSDGLLGDQLRRDLAAQGLHGVSLMTFDNGMRQIGTRSHPVRSPGDLKGLAVRVPDGAAFLDTFRALGARPVAINVNGIVDGLRSGRVDAQENALAVMEIFRLDREQRYVALTNHMWSGFNLMANLALWQKLPVDIRTVIENCAHDAITAQRVEQASFNIAVRDRFEQRGLIFNDVDQAPFRRQLSPIYEQWRAKLGATAWAILEREVGRLD